MASGKIKVKTFKDPILYKYLDDFSEIESNNKDSSKINRRLVPLLNNITLSQITTDWVIQLEENNVFLGGKALFARFIGFLIAKNNWEESKLNRLVECKVRYYIKVGKDDFKNLFESEIYNNFKEVYDLSDNLNIRLLLAKSVKTKSNNLNNFFDRYIVNFKLLNKYTSRTKLERIYNINKMIKTFFGKVNIKNLTQDDIISFLASKEIKRLNMVTFLDILIQLSKNNLIENIILNKFFKEIDRIYPSMKVYISPDRLIYYLNHFQSYSVFCSAERKKKEKDIFLVNIKSSYIRNELINFIKVKQVAIGPLRDFINDFDKSIHGQDVEYLIDLDYKTFNGQLKYYRNTHNNYLSVTYLVEFYRYLIANGKPALNDIANKRFIKRTSLGANLYDEYEIIFYQPIEKVPTIDKWILSYTEDQCTNDGINTTMTVAIDFTSVNNKELRYTLKHYMWYYPGKINTKHNNCKYIIRFLNYIDNYSNEKIITFNCEKSKVIDITLSKLASYRGSIINKYDKGNTIISHIYASREFLTHTSEYELLNIEKGYEFYLSYSRDTTYSDSLPIEDEYLELLFEEIKQNSMKSDLNSLYMIIFYMLIITELRPSNVVSLRKDCIEKISDKQYVINTETKTSNKEIIKIPISLETKKQIYKAIRLTKDSRLKCNDKNTKKYLFLTERASIDTYGVISVEKFNIYLKSICRKLNIPEYTASNLRDTHMTKAEQLIIEKNYSDIQQNVITGHKSTSVTESHYIKTDLKEAINIANDMVIGEENNSSEKDSSHLNNKDYSYNKILINKNFVTTPSEIYYFEAELKRVNMEIENCRLINKINELVTYQALIQGYIKKINTIKNQEE